MGGSDYTGGVIYLDILLGINLLVNYFLLFAAMRLSGRRPNRMRILFAAGIGAVYSLVMLLPEINAALLTVTKFAVCALMVLCAAGRSGWAAFLKETVIFFGVSFLYAGFLFAVWVLIRPSGMLFYNGIVYFNISVLTIVLSTLAAYIFVELFYRIFRRKLVKVKRYSVTLRYRERAVTLEGFVDTGNRLVGAGAVPVAVCAADALKRLLPAEMFRRMENPYEPDAASVEAAVMGIRYLPFTTVGGGGVLAVFRPDEMLLRDESGEIKTGDVFVALSGDAPGGKIILSPELLELERKGESVKII